MSEKGDAATRPFVLRVRSTSGGGGGPLRAILAEPRVLEPRGYDSACAIIHPAEDGLQRIRARAREAGARLISIPSRSPVDPRVVRALTRTCREQNVRIWHGHDYKSNLIGLLARRRWPMKLVTSVGGWATRTVKMQLYYALDRWCIARFDEAICISPDLHERCIAAGASPERCHLLPNGVDAEAFERTQSPAEARRALDLTAVGPVIGTVGRLAEEKGYDLLVRAAAALLDEGHEFTLLIAGDGPEHDRLARLIANTGHEERIRLVGFVSDVRLFLEALDGFVLSSHWEGLPNALLEAMAVGLPVLATRVAGVPDLVSDGDNGLLVSPGSADALEVRLRTLILDDHLRARLGEAARATVRSRFDMRTRLEAVVDIYDRLLGRAEAVSHA